jgi:hypothetical protein
MSFAIILSCKKHPRYQGKRPSKDCLDCMDIYNTRWRAETVTVRRGSHSDNCAGTILMDNDRLKILVRNVECGKDYYDQN